MQDDTDAWDGQVREAMALGMALGRRLSEIEATSTDEIIIFTIFVARFLSEVAQWDAPFAKDLLAAMGQRAARLIDQSCTQYAAMGGQAPAS